jgi:hypothetical protein
LFCPCFPFIAHSTWWTQRGCKCSDCIEGCWETRRGKVLPWSVTEAETQGKRETEARVLRYFFLFLLLLFPSLNILCLNLFYKWEQGEGIFTWKIFQTIKSMASLVKKCSRHCGIWRKSNPMTRFGAATLSRPPLASTQSDLQ